MQSSEKKRMHEHHECQPSSLELREQVNAHSGNWPSLTWKCVSQPSVADRGKIPPNKSHNRCLNKWDCAHELNSVRVEAASLLQRMGICSLLRVSWILLLQAWKVSSFALLISLGPLFIFSRRSPCYSGCVQCSQTPQCLDQFYGWLLHGLTFLLYHLSAGSKDSTASSLTVAGSYMIVPFHPLPLCKFTLNRLENKSALKTLVDQPELIL